VSNSFKDSLPADFIRKQTLVNGERFVSERLKVLEEELLTAQVSRQKLERDLFDKVRTKLLAHIAQLQAASRAVAGLDCLYSLAVVAVSNGYVRPKICTNSSELKIIGGRHPVVESYLKSGTFITNDTLLDTNESRTLVITGPNMAGKSTYMRQVALIVLLAHIGSFVPAQSADVPIVDKIFTRVGASDDLAFNQSTFMVEMVEVANILNNATKNSLIILDEVGRGTSTFDGLSIAWAIMEYVSHNIAAKTLFATHFHELTDLEGVIDGVKNYKIVVKEQGDGIIFLYKITRGGADKSFGIEVAALAGVPSAVCQRAKEIVKLLENSDITFKLDSVETAKSRKDASKQLADIAAILRDLDINRCSPIEAFEILADLTKRVKDK
jgi:DNA mismatch repair protein MutS